jgi:hypothetical protein
LEHVRDCRVIIRRREVGLSYESLRQREHVAIVSAADLHGDE